jgi:PKD repeat protein
MRIFLLSLLMVCSNHTHAGKKLRVLFIGNSYTYVNNMPQIVADIAKSTGDTLEWDMAATGGYGFSDHFTDAPTISKIMAGGWDYVTLQGQSAEPALPPYLFEPNVLPYARKLDSIINLYNPCAETIFYMTWGYKNGASDFCTVYSPTWPYYCTYASLDSVLRARYMLMADSCHAIVSPAGAVWHYIRTKYPGMELYQADESHPTEAGSYIVAASFYTALFRKDPSLTSYNFTLNDTDAANIRNAAKQIVYDSMPYWHIGQYKLDAGFSYTTAGTTANFTNTSVNASDYTWYFGDGQTSILYNPDHIYTTAGSYLAMMVANSNNCSDTFCSTITINPTGVANPRYPTDFTLTPNPVMGTLHIASPYFISGSCTIKICNGIGQQVYKKPSTNTKEQIIETSNLTKGIYLITVSSKNTQLFHKTFLKE